MPDQNPRCPGCGGPSRINIAMLDPKTGKQVNFYGCPTADGGFGRIEADFSYWTAYECPRLNLLVGSALQRNDALTSQDQMERGCKLAADIVCAVMLAVFSVVFFGWVGLIGFIILEAGLLAVDWLVPNEDTKARLYGKVSPQSVSSGAGQGLAGNRQSPPASSE